MTYAVQQDLIDRFGQQEILQLTDRNNTGSIDATVVARALTDADATINGYLAPRYVLPLATVPTVLVRLAADLARYQLFDDGAPPQVTQRYKDAIKFLQDVSSGAASIGVDAASQQPAAPSSGGPKVQANERTFTRGDPARGPGTIDDYAG